MKTDPRVQHRIESALNSAALTREPDGLLDSVLTTVSRTRMRPRWLALIKEPPMRIHSKVAAGSPVLRLVFLLVIAMLTTIVATGAVVTGASLLPGTTIVVAQDGSGTVRTISDAVALADDGDTILVRPGTYHESIVVSTDVTIRGDGERAAVVLEFSADGPTHTIVEGGVFAYGVLFDGTEARVENLTVRGPAEGVAVVIDGGAPVIDGIEVVMETDPDEPMYYKRSAFRVQGAGTPEIRDSAWDAYTRISGQGSSARLGGNTITGQLVAVGASGARAEIVGNTFLKDGGILLAEVWSSAIVEDNDIDGSLGGYIGTDTVIRGNRIRTGYQAGEGERGSAIQVTGDGTAIIEDNEITDAQYGIDVTGYGATPLIGGNTIRGSEFAAIVVSTGDPTIRDNVIEGNTTGIEVIGDIATPVISGNTLCQNGTDLKVPDDSTLTLEGNTICEETSATAP